MPMQKYRLERKHPADLLKDLEKSFKSTPVVPRECVKALNSLIFNMQSQKFDKQFLKEVIFRILLGLEHKDYYLRRCVYIALLEVGKISHDGILSINSLIKNIEDKKSPDEARDAALRTLYSLLPPSMYYDFDKYVKANVYSKRDTGVVITQQFICKESGSHPSDISYITDTSLVGNLSDYHRAYFLRMSLNKYTSLLEIRKIGAENPEKLSAFFYAATDPVILLEATKALAEIRYEVAAPYVEKAIGALSSLLRRDHYTSFAALRVLNRLSVNFPQKVSRVNRDIENLISSPFESVSMLAILTLLKTGTEESVLRVSSRLEPYLKKMSSGYKLMAINAMEHIALKGKHTGKAFEEAVDEYISFLTKAFYERGPLEFKEHIVSRFERLLLDGIRKDEILHMLSKYLEDPEHYQISIGILGLLGRFLESHKELPHIFNRLLLDNSHVRKAGFQCLFDLAARGVISEYQETLATFRDSETSTLCDLLVHSSDMLQDSDGKDISSLEDLDKGLREEVVKFLDEEEFVEEKKVNEKVCREIRLSPSSTDVVVTLVKVVKEKVVSFKFRVENKLKQVVINSALLTFSTDKKKIQAKILQSDFNQNGEAFCEVEGTDAEEGDYFSGLFEYVISMEDDPEEFEKESVELEGIAITPFDFMNPAPIDVFPTFQKSLEIVLDCKPTQAASEIADVANLYFAPLANSIVTFSGYYNDIPVVLRGTLRASDVTVVNLEVFCDDEALAERIVSVFE